MTHRGAFMHHHYKKGVFGMAKKGWGKFVAFAAVTGAVAAGVSYVLQYKTYHRELEKDFREFEDGGEDRTDEDGTERTIDARSLDRNYISLSSSKDEFKVAAKDMAQATKNVLKDAGSLLSDTAHEAVSAAVDTAQIALQTVKTKKADFMDEHSRDKADDSDLFEDEGFLDDDYVDEDDLYDYRRMDGSSSYDSGDLTEDDYDDSSEEPEKSEAGRSTAIIEEDTLE